MKRLTFGTLASLMCIVFFETLLSMKRLAQMPYLRRSLIALIVSLILTSASQAQLADTKIAFASDRDGNYEIYVMDADGKNPIRLTNHPADDWGPSWSPDGTKIAFASERDGNAEIYVMGVDGKNVRNLTNQPASDFAPAWSPDGRQIAFVSWWGGGADMYVMDADGKNQTRLTKNGLGWGSFVAAFNDDAGSPSWSPGGTKIAFSSKRDGNVDIYVMDADGKNPIRLTNNPAQDAMPSWSPFPMAVSVKERLITLWGKVKVGK